LSYHIQKKSLNALVAILQYYHTRSSCLRKVKCDKCAENHSSLTVHARKNLSFYYHPRNDCKLSLWHLIIYVTVRCYKVLKSTWWHMPYIIIIWHNQAHSSYGSLLSNLHDILAFLMRLVNILGCFSSLPEYLYLSPLISSLMYATLRS